MTNEEAVFCIFLMRFNLQPLDAMAIVKKWLTEHPADNWQTLKDLFNEDKLTVINGKIKAIGNQEKPDIPKYRGVAIDKNRPENHLARNPQKLSKYRGVEIQPQNYENFNVNQEVTKKRRYRGQEY